MLRQGLIVTGDIAFNVVTSIHDIASFVTIDMTIISKILFTIQLVIFYFNRLAIRSVSIAQATLKCRSDYL